jgi:hypothetical protein
MLCRLQLYNVSQTIMFYPIHASRHEQMKLSVFVPALEVMHPVLSDRQTDAVPNTHVTYNRA